MTGTLCHLANSAQYALGVNLSAVAQLLGVDETLLWSGSPQTGTVMNLAEPLSNFRYAKMYFDEYGNGAGHGVFEFNCSNLSSYVNCCMQTTISRPDNSNWSASVGIQSINFVVYDDYSKLSGLYNKQFFISNIFPSGVRTNGETLGWRSNTAAIYKVVGIGRKQ